MRGAGALVAALNIHTLESTHVPNALRALVNIYKPKNNKIYFVRTVAIRAAGKFTRKEFKKACLYLDIKHKLLFTCYIPIRNNGICHKRPDEIDPLALILCLHSYL